MVFDRRKFLQASAAASALGMFGPRAAAQGSGPIKIGAFGPMSGNAAAQGQSLRAGMEMVVKARNASGGIGGRPIDLIVGDDAGKPEEAAVIARRFATRDNVAIALGSVSSPASLAAAQVFREEQLPQIVVSGTAQRITTQGNEWVFRCTIPDRKFVADLADFINEKFPKLKRIAFIYVNDDFGKGGFDSFVEAAKKHGMTMVADERYTRGDVDFTAQLTKIRAANPDALVDWSRYTEGALIQRQLRQAGMGNLARFGSDGIAPPAFLELAGEAANGVIYATHFSPATSADNPQAQRFIEAFRKEYGKLPDYVHAQAFDAINIAIAAIERAKSTDHTAIRNALRQTDYASTRGPFKFDSKGDPTLVSHMVRIVDMKETNARL
ncbi:MAG TPA: ABC transporter substrate-binding protein [Burkholderiales bacterium]|nr:ABC transporter substrate-binding protein [Burkholderiales bacterium]